MEQIAFTVVVKGESKTHARSVLSQRLDEWFNEPTMQPDGNGSYPPGSLLYYSFSEDRPTDETTTLLLMDRLTKSAVIEFRNAKRNGQSDYFDSIYYRLAEQYKMFDLADHSKIVGWLAPMLSDINRNLDLYE